jgi:hypothetical protein
VLFRGYSLFRAGLFQSAQRATEVSAMAPALPRKFFDERAACNIMSPVPVGTKATMRKQNQR